MCTSAINMIQALAESFIQWAHWKAYATAVLTVDSAPWRSQLSKNVNYLRTFGTLSEYHIREVSLCLEADFVLQKNVRPTFLTFLHISFVDKFCTSCTAKILYISVLEALAIFSSLKLLRVYMPSKCSTINHSPSRVSLLSEYFVESE